MVRNATMRTTLANAYKTAAPYGALFSADPGTSGSATNELTGGSPAYARKALNWGTAANSAVTSSATSFDVAASATVAYFGVTTAGTAAVSDLQDSVAVTSQTFSGQGTYTITATYTQA
jgi:hypothetical protein